MSRYDDHLVSPENETHVNELAARVQELETSIREMEERLSRHSRVFHENPVPAVIYETQTLKIVEANNSALALYGYERQQICSLRMTDLFGREAQREEPNLIENLRQTANTIGPFVHYNASGQELVVSVVSFGLSFSGVDARIMMVRDETARHNAEEALRASEERYRELFENANDVIFLHDLKGRILAINRAAEYLTGYTRSEVVGQSFDRLLAPEARHQTHDSIRAHLGGSATQHYELPIVSKYGNRRFLEVSTRIIYRLGQAVAIQGIGRDITERKQAQRRLEESSLELQEKNKELSTALRLAQEATQLKEQFLANTSHELRTPMNGIMGMVDLLQQTALGLDQQEYADAINQCAQDLLTIINDILDVSQIEAGRIALDEEPFSIREGLNAVVKMLKLRAIAKDLVITSEVDPDFPALIYGDSVRVKQILTNLIANAVKFTPEGTVRIRLYPAEGGSRFRCEVIDSGIGVPEAVKDRIFEAFFQADGTTRRKFGGTGLGLTISKQLVEIMGGQIGTYNNAPRAGSTFWFELPMRTAAALSAAGF